jgi:hypothetical protein
MTKPTTTQIRAALREHMRGLALKGGEAGAKARMAELTAEERRKLAIRARWRKAKKG